MTEKLEVCEELHRLQVAWFAQPGNGHPQLIDAHRRACPTCQRNAARLRGRTVTFAWVAKEEAEHDA